MPGDVAIKANPFDYPYDGKLEPGRTALLVIDLQIDFLSQNGYFARKGYDPSPLRSILPNVNAVIAAARGAGCLVVHTRQGHRDDLADMTPYARWRRRRAGLEGTNVLLRSAPGYQIDPAVDVNPNDIIVDKIANGAFTDTELEMVLRAKGISHLLFSGCTTDVCVHTSLREANDRNFQCLLIEDACASADQYAHDAAIHMVGVEDGIFGVVAKSSDVVDALSRCR
jgi:nicotinamidase-related amidase